MVTPNRPVSPLVRRGILLAWVVGVVTWLTVYPPPIFPRPLEVLTAWWRLFSNGSLLPALASSLVLNVEAVAISTGISLLVSYAAVVALTRPIPAVMSKLRYLGLTGLTFAFGQVWSGHELKLSLLVLTMSTFTITGMLAVIAAIPRESYDHARTLRMSPWRTVYEVVVRGTAHQMLDVVRQNGAIGWVMLITAEGLVRTEGGLGVLLFNENHALRLDTIYALQLTIFVIAMVVDTFLALLGSILFPFAHLNQEKA